MSSSADLKKHAGPSQVFLGPLGGERREAVFSGGDYIENFDFDRQHRLRAAAEFSEVFSARRVLRGARFALHYRPNGKPHARLGLVIPKKQARAAVLRNAIKRQARELFRQRRKELPPMDLVLRLARPAVLPVRVIDRQIKAEWRAEIGALFARLNDQPSDQPGDQRRHSSPERAP